MRLRTRLGLAAAAALLLAGWYFFRPERAFLDRSVNEQAPGNPGGVAVLAAGSFTSHAHATRGRAEVLRLPDGRRMLRLTNFATLNGPDVQVYLIGRAAITGRAGLREAGFITLGAMKGNIGDQNYLLPDDADLARYPVVAIWCRRFAVNFGDAPLAGPAS